MYKKFLRNKSIGGISDRERFHSSFFPSSSPCTSTVGFFSPRPSFTQRLCIMHATHCCCDTNPPLLLYAVYNIYIYYNFLLVLFFISVTYCTGAGRDLNARCGVVVGSTAPLSMRADSARDYAENPLPRVSMIACDRWEYAMRPTRFSRKYFVRFTHISRVIRADRIGPDLFAG